MTELERYTHVAIAMQHMNFYRDAITGASGIPDPSPELQTLAAVLVDIEELRQEITKLEQAHTADLSSDTLPIDVRSRLREKVLEPLRFEHGRLQYAVETGDALPAHTVKPIESDVRMAIAELRAIIGDTDNRYSWDEEVRNND